MTKEEFLKFASSAEGKNILKETGHTVLNKEVVNNYLTSNEEGKSLLFSLNDKEYERRFKKFENEKLPEMLEKKYQEKHPDMTEEQKKLRAMEQELEGFKREKIKATNFKQLSELNKDYNLPNEFFEMLVGEDLEKSKAKITEIGTKYKADYEAKLAKDIDEKLANGYKPGAGGGSAVDTELSGFEKALNGEI